MKELDYLYQQCKDKIRYGELWSSFDVDELIAYSRVKSKRAGILLTTDFMSEGQRIEAAIDDLLDSANLAIMAAKRIEELAERDRLTAIIDKPYIKHLEPEKDYG